MNSTSTRPIFDPAIKYRLSTRIVLLFSLLIAAAILSIGGWLYLKNRDILLMNLQDQLQLAANTISLSIDGDQYRHLKGKESLNSPIYREIYQKLERFMVNSYLGFQRNNIYTFRQVSADSLEFTVMLDEQYVGERYAIREEMRLTLEKGNPSYTDIYMDENGTWLSAYAPILDSNNAVVGLVEVDFRDNVYLMLLQEELFSLLYMLLFGLVVAVLAAYALSHYISRPIIEVSRAAVELSQGNVDIRIPVYSGDEIGRLSRAFNFMVQEIQEKEYIQNKNREISEINRRLDEVNHSLREANRLKSEFLSIAVHDLKNPLGVIQGYLEIMLEDKDLSEESRSYCENIFNGTKRMLTLVRQLLDTTAIESGKMNLKIQPLDLTAIVREVVEGNTALASRKNQSLKFSGKSACTVQADFTRIHEIVDNLISNAIKFSPPGLPIYVSTRQTSNNKSMVLLEVRDEGPGLTDTDKKKLFGRFVRLSALPTGGELSTGLGLSVVRQLVELHQGRVWAESSGVGQGSSFFVELPLFNGVTPEES